ncbi:MAG: hypothetical protein JNL60_14500 [Bacteroidia bacterium]|nr:hypothetical protein [Bacteroidia bacterium]
MKSASLSDVKKELQALDAKDLVELCISLAKYKKDNKDYLSYLLFESHDKSAVIKEIRAELDSEFMELKKQENLYYVKKGLRRILRQLNRYVKYLGDKASSTELNIYFCLLLKESGIPFRRNKLIVNLYEQQLKKISALIAALHEDLRGDYEPEFEKIIRY